jgi:hypothetical protein
MEVQLAIDKSAIFGRRLALACILIVYVFNVERWHPVNFFGRFHDDSIYFTTAKALAQGWGYTLVSFPGSPPQTKYPILYPWLLSWIWKLHPSFPANLKPAIRLTEFFGCWSLVAAFLLLRKLPGVGEQAALLLTALCAFQPIFLRLSGVVMSDIPFMAFLLTALVLADPATRSGAGLPAVVAAGAVAGLSVGTRTIGFAVVAGIFFLALRRRAFREAFLFAAVAGFVIAIESWPMLLHRAATPNAGGTAEPGWNQVLAYYTDYVEYQWHMGIPSVWALVNLVKLNSLLLITSPGSVIVGPLGKWGSPVTAALSVPVWLGIARQVKADEWKPVAFVLFFYVCVILVWSFPQPERFLLPFIPVFFAGLWLEMRRLGAMVLANLRGGRSLSQRVLAGALAGVLASLLAMMGWNYVVSDPRALQLASGSQTRALEERQEAYQWIREHAGPTDRIAAYDDAVMYLYTGRQGLRPVTFLPMAGYASDEESLRRDLAHISDAPRHAGVRYWLTTNDDFGPGCTCVGKDQIDARMSEITMVLPVVFRSRDKYAQIYDASCLTQLERSDCRAAAPILFPR